MGKHIEHTVNIGRNKDIITIELSFRVSAESARIFSILGDEGQWPEDFRPRILKRQPHERLLLAFEDFSRVEVNLETTEVGCLVSIAHELIKTPEDRAEFKNHWATWFENIEKRVAL